MLLRRETRRLDIQRKTDAMIRLRPFSNTEYRAVSSSCDMGIDIVYFVGSGQAAMGSDDPLDCGASGYDIRY